MTIFKRKVFLRKPQPAAWWAGDRDVMGAVAGDVKWEEWAGVGSPMMGNGGWQTGLEVLEGHHLRDVTKGCTVEVQIWISHNIENAEIVSENIQPLSLFSYGLRYTKVSLFLKWGF